MTQENEYEYGERRAMVEQQFREDPELNYEDELAQKVDEELSNGFNEFCQTAEYLMTKQKAILQDIDDAAYQEEQREEYRMIHRDDLEQPLRESYEESFQQKVEEAMA